MFRAQSGQWWISATAYKLRVQNDGFVKIAILCCSHHSTYMPQLPRFSLCKKGRTICVLSFWQTCQSQVLDAHSITHAHIYKHDSDHFSVPPRKLRLETSVGQVLGWNPCTYMDWSWYDLRQYQPPTGTCLVGACGKISLIWRLYQSQYQAYTSQKSALDPNTWTRLV